jgi:hypothetical protein
MQIKLYLSNEIDTIKQYFQETLQIIEAVIYKMVGAVAIFRKNCGDGSPSRPYLAAQPP